MKRLVAAIFAAAGLCLLGTSTPASADELKQTFVMPTPQQLAAWKMKVEPTVTGWTKTANGADTVLAKFKEELANVKAGH